MQMRNIQFMISNKQSGHHNRYNMWPVNSSHMPTIFRPTRHMWRVDRVTITDTPNLYSLMGDYKTLEACD